MFSYKKIFFLLIILTINIFSENEINIGYKQLSSIEILNNVDSYRGYEKAFRMEISVIDYGENENEINRLNFIAYVKNRSSSLLKYTYPVFDKNKLLLMIKNNIWFYHKKISNPLRLSPRQRLLGNVSNADVARANFSYDYIPKIIGEDNINNKKVIIMDLIAKNKNVAYSKIKLYIDINDYRPIKGEYYAISGKIIKTSYYVEFQEVKDSLKLKKVEIFDNIIKTKKTIIEYGNFEEKELPNHYYNSDFLPRIKRIWIAKLILYF